MAGQGGRDVLVGVGDGGSPIVFATIVGRRANLQSECRLHRGDDNAKSAGLARADRAAGRQRVEMAGQWQVPPGSCRHAHPAHDSQLGAWSRPSTEHLLRIGWRHRYFERRFRLRHVGRMRVLADLFEAACAGADVSLTWIMRARKGGDPRLAGEPAREWPEGYRMRVSDGVLVREWGVAEAVVVYSAGDKATNSPGGEHADRSWAAWSKRRDGRIVAA